MTRNTTTPTRIARVFLYRGTAYFALGEYDEAVEHFQFAIDAGFRKVEALLELMFDPQNEQDAALKGDIEAELAQHQPLAPPECAAKASSADEGQSQ